MGLGKNCGSLRVMSTLPYLDYLLHLSMEMMIKCERVQGMHIIQRVQIVVKFWYKDKDIVSVLTVHNSVLTLILRRSHTGTVWFYTSTSNKRAARPKLYTKSLTRDLKLMYSRFTLVRISINL